MRWEYLSLWCDYDQLQPQLKESGLDGWELVGFQLNDREARWYLIFKRPLE